MERVQRALQRAVWSVHSRLDHSNVGCGVMSLGSSWSLFLGTNNIYEHGKSRMPINNMYNKT